MSDTHDIGTLAVLEAERPAPPQPAAPEKDGRSVIFMMLVLLAILAGVLIIALAVIITIVTTPDTPSEAPTEVQVSAAESAGTSDTITYFDPTLGEISLPVYGGVPVNSYDRRDFVSRGGFIYYGLNGTDSYSGIDVSDHQGEIDWEKVAADGVDFAMIRVGYRGYTAGGIIRDSHFQENIEGALAAGLDVGIYFFSQAVNVREAKQEAEFVLENLSGYDIAYPVCFDWEFIAEASARTDRLSASAITNCALAFCEAVEAEGYTAAVYFNQSLGYLKYNLSELSPYGFWLAEYDNAPDFYYSFKLWQYTSKGRVDGIEGDVDLNISFENFAAARQAGSEDGE